MKSLKVLTLWLILICLYQSSFSQNSVSELTYTKTKTLYEQSSISPEMENYSGGINEAGSTLKSATATTNYNVYYGHIHNHSNVSDGTGTPEQAYYYAKNNAGLDFFGLSDHAYLTDDTEWASVKAAANNYNEDDVFTTFWGFEWSHSTQGHVTVINTDDYCTKNTEPTFSDLLSWVNSRECAAFFNHPGRQNSTGQEFGHFLDTPSDQFVGMELWNKSGDYDVYYYNDGYYSNDGNLGYLDEALSRDWKIGAEGSDDNHSATWGTDNDYRMAILATNLTRADLFEAILNRRFYSTLDKNLKMSFTINGNEMGSKIQGDTGQAMQILVSDDDGENFTQVQLFKNGLVANTWPLVTSTVAINENISTSDGDYYYIKVTQADGDEAISSPIFIEGGISNTPPNCAITGPEAETYYNSTQIIVLSADAADSDGLIAQVEFFVNNVSVGVDVTSPYSLNWTIPSDGTYSISAKATDNLGAETTSDPVNITVGAFSDNVSVQISSSNDDVEEAEDGYMYMNSSDIELVYDSYVSHSAAQGNQTVGLRFTDLGIPQGAAITNAYVQFTCDEVVNNSGTMYIFGQAIDDSPAFSSSTGDVSSRTKTSASVTWNPPSWNSEGASGVDQQTSDISAVIQEIVDRPGFSSLSAVSIIITGTGTRIAEAYEGSAASAAILNIEYSVGEQNAAPVFNSDPIIEAAANEDALYETSIADNASDADQDVLTFSKVSGPFWLTVSSDGILSGTPLNENVGLNTWTVQVSDGNGSSDQAELQITVLNTNDSPVFNTDTIVLDDAFTGVAYSGSIAEFASDPDAGDNLIFTTVSGPAWLLIGGNGDLSGTPGSEDAGTNLWTVHVKDDSGETDQSTLQIVVKKPDVNEYCESYSQSYSDEYIASVTVGDLNNSSDGSVYSDFTYLVFNAEPGISYSISLEPWKSNKVLKESWRVWIDYNLDGDFDDSGELVFSSDGKRNAVTGTFTIPTGVSGTTRMRITMANSSISSIFPCDQDLFFGEVEDYTIIIGSPTPLPPVANFEADRTTIQVGETVTFTDLSANNPTSLSWSFVGGTPDNSSASNPTVTYNSAGDFDVTLTTVNDVGSDTKTSVGYISVVNDLPTPEYCSSASTSNDLEWIEQVDIGVFSNPSVASLYSDFTNMIIPLEPGSSPTVTITPYFTGHAQREFFRIWIDFSQDGDFEDSGETVFIANNKKGATSGTIDIPSGLSGQTRMRVSMKNGGEPGPCEIFTGGEVEDYMVSFGSAIQQLKKASIKPQTVEKISGIRIYPNPAEGQLILELNENALGYFYQIFDLQGRKITNHVITSETTSIDLTCYVSGVYLLVVTSPEGTFYKKFVKK